MPLASFKEKLFLTMITALRNQLNFHLAHMPGFFIRVYLSDGADHVQSLQQKVGLKMGLF